VSSYGGVDDPVHRNGYGPAGFRPLQNPFYVALPYCDLQAGRLKPEAAKVVPWFVERFRGPGLSVCRGRWLEIRSGVKTCYAQWEDVGPFCTDSAGYVFGNERPPWNLNHGAGIDVSPAVRDYLELESLGLVDWRFVEQAEVPPGPLVSIRSHRTSRDIIYRVQVQCGGTIGLVNNPEGGTYQRNMRVLANEKSVRHRKLEERSLGCTARSRGGSEAILIS
jgi:hypothetical protein